MELPIVPATDGQAGGQFSVAVPSDGGFVTFVFRLALVTL